MRKKLLWCSFMVGLAALVMFAEQKKPGRESTQLVPGTAVPVATGYDIAVVDIGTSGASTSPVYAPVITLKNMGQRTINRTLEMNYTCNGFQLTSGELVTVALAPGDTYVWRGGVLHENMAKPGDLMQAVVDPNKKMLDDNRVNNTLSKRIPQPFHPHVAK
jgi:hypothetical protein